MYYFDTRQHHRPHIHVKYQDEEVVLAIPDGEVLGVLHHDSADFDVFDEIDVKYLTQISQMIAETLKNQST